jgi:hypothetical protein
VPIEATFFNEMADQYSFLEEGRTYLMNGGTIKLAQKKFSSLSNDFCIVFDKPKLTEITEYYA